MPWWFNTGSGDFFFQPAGQATSIPPHSGPISDWVKLPIPDNSTFAQAKTKAAGSYPASPKNGKDLSSQAPAIPINNPVSGSNPIQQAVDGLAGSVASGLEKGFLAILQDAWKVLAGPLWIIAGGLIVLLVIGFAFKDDIMQVAGKVPIPV